MNPTNANAIRCAAKLILTPGRWCQGALARDREGYVAHYDENAYSFCALGALWKSGLSRSGMETIEFLISDSLGEVNDFPSTTAEDMAMLLLLAAEILEKT